MNICGKAGKVILIISNFLFVVLGLGLVLVGALLRENSNTMHDEVLPLLNKIGIGPGFTLGELLNVFSITAIVTGVVSFCMSVIGASGACCKSRPLLIIYAVSVCIIGGGEIYGLKLWFDLKKELGSDELKKEFLSLLSDYGGEVGKTMTTSWNVAFVLFECCGVNAQSSVDDFGSTVWGLTRGLDVIPSFCCKDRSKNTALPLLGTPCTLNPTSSNSNIKNGCYSAIVEVLTGYGTVFLVICLVILAVETFVVFCAVLMVVQISHDIKANKYRTKNDLELHSGKKKEPNIVEHDS